MTTTLTPLTRAPALGRSSVAKKQIMAIMFREGYDLRDATLAAFRRAGVEPQFAVQGGEMDAVLRFTEAGLGVAVLPSMVLEGRPNLRGVPLVPKLTRTIGLARRRDVEPSRAATVFRELLLTVGVTR